MIHNIALLICLTIIYGLIYRRYNKKEFLFTLLTGLLFGFVCLIGMLTPVHFLPGIIFDGRSIILFAAGLTGGPVIGLIAAIIAGVYRLWLGGAGTLMGILVIAESVSLGITLYYLRQKYPFFKKLYWIWVFGLLVHILMLIATRTLLGDVSAYVFRHIALPVLVIHPIACLIVGILIIEIESHFSTVRTLKETQRDLESAQQRAHIGSWVLYSGTLTSYWSREMYILLYFDPKGGFPSAKRLLMHIHPDDRAVLIKDFSTAFKSEIQIYREYRTNPKYGPERVIVTQFYSEYDELHKKNRIVGTCLDITEQKKAEKALNDEKTFLSTVIQSIPDMVWLKDPEGVYLAGNPRFEEFIGMKESAFLGKTDYDLFDKDLADFFRDYDRKAIEAGKPSINEEWVTFASDGHQALMETIKSPIFDSQHALIGVLGIARDITERSRAEELLKKSETRFRELFEHSPVAYQSLDAEGRFLDVNEKLCELLGYEREELIGRVFSDFWSLDTKDKFKDIFGCFVREGQTRGELKLVRKNGQLVVVLLEGRIQRDSQNNFVRTHCILADITERKMMEEQLKKAQSIAMVGNWVYDVKNAILTGSEECHKILEWQQETMDLESFFNLIHPEDLEKVKTSWKLIYKGLPYEIEYRVILLKTVKWIYVKADSEKDAVGNIIRIVGIIQDISERKKAEEERARLDIQMRDLQKLESLGILAGGLAHDFNNLLMAILGHTSLLQNELSSSSSLKPDLDNIEKAAHQASEICRQMLAYSGRGKFVVQNIQLSSLVKDMLELLKTSMSKKVELKLQLDENIPAIQADITQIRQVLLNLITNASEALEDRNGYISLATGVKECSAEYISTLLFHEDMKEGPYAYLQVSDNGIGMDKQTMEHIFDPFFTTKFMGRGLGLAAVLGIIRGHHGGIQIHSSPGKGTTFIVYLPVMDTMDIKTEEEPVAVAKKWRAQGNVLLVDDEEAVRTVAKLMLEKIGYSVYTASDGQEALKIYRMLQSQIDFILLDMTMPQMDGEETFNELIKINPQAKVILSSGVTEQEIKTRFNAKGLAGFIQKPYTLSGLRENLKSINTLS
jgi:PAS domain S-box-containing protein